MYGRGGRGWGGDMREENTRQQPAPSFVSCTYLIGVEKPELCSWVCIYGWWKYTLYKERKNINKKGMQNER